MSKWLHFGPNPIYFPNTVFSTIGATSQPMYAVLRNSWKPKIPITIKGMVVKGLNASDFAIASNNCPTVITPGLKCTVELTFTPSALGLRKARLNVRDNAGNRPQIFWLRGYGVRGRLKRSTKILYFGKVVRGGSGKAKTVTLTNPNTVPLNIRRIVARSEFGEFSETNDCIGALGAGESCTVSVLFKPNTGGLLTGRLKIHDNARHSPQIVYLQGHGIK